MTAADFHGYLEAQREAAAAYRDQRRWVEMSISNTANSGRFSSDRTIAEYNRDIWHLTQVQPRP
jgi:starch phosphorylase